MAKIVGRNASLFIYDGTGACKAVSGYVNNIALSYTADAPDVTGFGDSDRTRLAGGLRDWTLDCDAFYTTAANEIDSFVFPLLGGSTMFTFYPAGSAAGSPSYSSCAVLTKYDMKFTVADAATVALSLVNRSGSMTRVGAS